MGAALSNFMRQQLVDRRHRLEQAASRSHDSVHLRLLLNEVDGALSRIENGSFGICESCHESIEADRLVADPLVRICLDHLSKTERNALEHDLELAARVQRGLLPRQTFRRDGWHICYHYEAAGLVSGDYCDVIDAGEAGLYFMVGDVSGKGLAASMLMAHLHAMFRTLISVQLPLACMLKHASRVFSESTLPSQYATLVCGRAMPDGTVEISNAGHPPPLLVHNGKVTLFEQSDLPVGLFPSEEFSITELHFEPGDGLVLYSDGVSEAVDPSGGEYSAERLQDVIRGSGRVNAPELVAACRDDLTGFRAHAPKTDDVTLFVLGRELTAETRVNSVPVQELAYN
ncbi:MAG TPA: SpoIIE family protein phosphatase [Bryobacteraceae bacterium]